MFADRILNEMRSDDAETKREIEKLKKKWVGKKVSFTSHHGKKKWDAKVTTVGADKDGFYLEVKTTEPDEDAYFDKYEKMVYLDDKDLKVH